MKLIRILADTFLPGMCICCGQRILPGEHLVCTDCLQEFPKTGFASKPYDNKVVYALAGWVNVCRGASLYYYQSDSLLSTVVKRMKYGGRKDLCHYMGEVLASEMMLEDFFFGIDAIIPVPLHRKRRRLRGYNQTEELAKGINKLTGIPVITDAIERTRYQENQARQMHGDRESNIEGAFSLINGASIEGKHVMVLDDVITTGATIGTCCRELSKVDGVTVSVLSLCKTK